MNQNFDTCPVDALLKHEGGYVNPKTQSTPGGMTNLGNNSKTIVTKHLRKGNITMTSSTAA